MSSMQEFELIRWIRERARSQARVTLGIGDDAAVLDFPRPAGCLLASDMLMEGVHFTLPEATPRQIGRKALGVNLSDIAAMAGVPLAALVCVAWSRRHGAEVARGVQAGIQELADEFGVSVAGGDTNVWDGPLVVCVTIVGEATERGAVRRAGALPGDWILATGSFGGSFGGKHLDFPPRVREALRIHEQAAIHAMIDVSDGLAADLHHILDESGVGAVLWAERIPISDAVRANQEKSRLEHALSDGEDFELILAVPPEDARRLLTSAAVETPLTHLGEIVAGAGCEMIEADGRRCVLPRSGWEHTF